MFCQPYEKTARNLYKPNSFSVVMAFKLINANEAKSGVTILIDGEACIVRINDVSKTGKHGHAKCRIEAISVISGKKKVLVMPGHERFDVPRVEKRKAQILSLSQENLTANVMDLESFETFDIPVFEDLREEIHPEEQVEYWVIEDKDKIIKRKL